MRYAIIFGSISFVYVKVNFDDLFKYHYTFVVRKK